MRLTFYGAARTVTGSKYLVEIGDKKLLVDCGLFQGKKELRLLNWSKPIFNPKTLDAIVLTHAHIDHTGFLPLVVKQGFHGPIFCNGATKALLHLLLPDTAHLQEEEARHANAHGSSRHHPALPLYNGTDAENTLKLLKVIDSRRSTEILPNIRVTPSCAGHILGATSISLDAEGKRITFSGDVGRYDVPVLPDPQPVDLGDLVLCESTYGDREHPKADIRMELAKIINLAVERKGPLIVPSFAVGRAQDLLFYLRDLELAGKIPVLPVFVDSPMAIDATAIYRAFKNDYDEETLKMVEDGQAIFRTERTTFTHAVEESKRLNGLPGAHIIISASGMVTGGRILHHMLHNLPRENATVLFVGFQAEGTRGRIIQSGEESVRIFGQEVPIRAHIETLSSLSGHGDRTELLRWLKSCRGTPRTVRIVHGEKEVTELFAQTVEREFGWKAKAAEYLETVEI